MEHILVTGGTGFVGRHVVKKLAKEGHRVYTLVRNKEKLTKALGKEFLIKNNVSLLELRDPAKLTSSDYKRVIEQSKITTVVHTAALVGERLRTSWNEYYKINVVWAENLARGFLDSDVSHNKFLFISTAGVYGTIPQRLPADEETEYNPDGKYHKSKALAEKKLIVLKNKRTLPLIILRPSTMYGEDDYGFLYKIYSLYKKKVLMFSSHLLHLLSVNTLAEVVSFFVKEHVKANYYIVNVADDHHIEFSHLLNFAEEFGIHGKAFKIPKAFLHAVYKFFLGLNMDNLSLRLKMLYCTRYYDLSRLRAIFGDIPSTENELKKFGEWYASHVL